MAATIKLALLALALVLCSAPSHADTVSAAIATAATRIDEAKAKLDEQLIKACENLQALQPQCTKSAAQLQALPKAITDKLTAKLDEKLATVNNCFRSKLSTSTVDDKQFVCCLDLKSFARSTLCIPANTLDANLPDLIAKSVTDKADDAVKKALAPVGAKVNDALEGAKDALAAAQKKVDDALAALSG